MVKKKKKIGEDEKFYLPIKVRIKRNNEFFSCSRPMFTNGA